MITRLLVANRSEIARRIFTTCRRLGIETVAVYSDADAASPYVSEADFAIRLPGSAPGETYLRGDLIIAAAKQSGADAVHPGYGFLSENADFARAVIAAGLTWVGPAPESIEAMGDKVRAKTLMAKAGVPTLGDLTPETATAANLPLLVKASAGGGGCGMRIVRSLADLPGEIERASAEAASAFGDGTVFVEPYVESARHIEVQVVGDPLGFVVVLGERDCSIQRRHQKVIEESPAPGLTAAQREAIHDAARTAADAIDYLGAGTVEFLVDAADPSRFWFLEMNTRLQVEHPVTEAVTGLDLVEAQLAVAEGRSPDLDEPAIVGHAIEARVYAEDPAADWQPHSGTLTEVALPDLAATFQPPRRHGVRLDSGVETGSEVSAHYDAMLAKVIAWGNTREEANRALIAALRRARFTGLPTNRELLLATLSDSEFIAGNVSTDFFARTGVLASLAEPASSPALIRVATAAIAHDCVAKRVVQQGVPLAWRNVVSQPQTTEFVGHDPVTWLGGGRFATFPETGVEVLSVRENLAAGYHVDYLANGVRTWADVHLGDGLPGRRRVEVQGPQGALSLVEVPRFTDPAESVAVGSLLAPMPGVVISVAVTEGQKVAAGDPVLVLEAMKMQHTVTAPAAGTVAELRVREGQQVAAAQVLVVVEELEEGE